MHIAEYGSLRECYSMYKEATWQEIQRYKWKKIAMDSVANELVCSAE